MANFITLIPSLIVLILKLMSFRPKWHLIFCYTMYWDETDSNLSSSINKWLLLRNIAHIATAMLKLLRAFICSVEPGCVYLKSINILSAMLCWHLQRFSIEITEISSLDNLIPNKILNQWLSCSDVCRPTYSRENDGKPTECCVLLSLLQLYLPLGKYLYLLLWYKGNGGTGVHEDWFFWIGQWLIFINFYIFAE